MPLTLTGAGSVIASMAPPSTPTGFTATAQESATLLSWDAQPEADTFEIYFGTTNVFGSASLLTTSATGTSFTHNAGNGIQPGQKYFYWIRAVNTDGESAWSSSVTARSFVIIADGASQNLVTPTGTWTIGTILFASASLPSGVTIAYGFDAYDYIGGGVWLDQNTAAPSQGLSISGAFQVQNYTGSNLTFWNTEP